MTFLWPTMLLLLVAIPLAVGGYVRLQRQRSALRARSAGFVQAAAGRSLGARRHIPPGLFLVGLTMLLIALARPETTVSLPRIEGTVILAFDVSGSMAATDLQPTRMEAAKTVARDFVQRQPPSVQIGVVAFSDSGFAVQAPTNDQTAILGAINRISPQRGTSLGQGMRAALNTIDIGTGQTQRRYSTLTATPVPQRADHSAAIILLTDGENNAAPNPVAVAQEAAERGVRVYPVGIGSAAGTTLRVNGFNVFTKLDEPTLQQIAQLTEGTYYNVARQDDLTTIYDGLALKLVIKPEQTEVTSLFTGVGVLALLLGGACSLLWLSRVP